MQITGWKGTRIRVAEVACLAVLLGATFCTATGEIGPAAVDPPFRRGLKILYAGRPGSDREKDFVSFLNHYFDVVQTGNLETFKEADTQGFDVILLDWDINVFEGPCPALSANFSRPVITLGVRGSMLCSRWRLKMTYL